MIGGRKFIVRNLLEIANIFPASNEVTTQVGWAKENQSFS